MMRTLLALLFLACTAEASAAQLVAKGSVWKYLDDGSDQGTAWRDSAFDDSAWDEGPAELGYGDGDEATVVSFGPNSGAKFVTTYFRHTFTVASPNAVTFLKLDLLRDDGAVVYLNGTEIVRSNMPGGTIFFDTLASSTVGGAGESAFSAFLADPALLVSGDNVLAVEIHQRSRTSSDISFDLVLDDSPAANVIRGPYLQKGTDSSVVVRWRTLTSTDSQVEYGLSPGSLTLSVSDASASTEHELEITGLSPGTDYYYAVGSTAARLAGGDADHFVRTAPARGSEKPFRVWILGDSGTATQSASDVRDAYYTFTGSTHTNLWLMLGDNAYDDGTDPEYQAAVFDMYPEMLRKSTLWPTRGNHETVASTYYGIFTMPTAGEAGGYPSGTEAYYSFDYGNAHFICLDSEGSDRSSGGAMLQWLQDDLNSTDQHWIIAFWHHPPYTKGSHDSDDPSDSGGRMKDMRENALPILEAGGVDLVYTGHSHSYERSFLIGGHYDISATFDPLTMMFDGGDGRDDGDGAYSNTVAMPHDGTVYSVAGSSGKTSAGTFGHPVMYTSQRRLGSVVIDVDGDRLDVKFVDRFSAVRDYFTLTTSGAPPALSTTPLLAGQSATLKVSEAAPGNEVVFAYSASGPGPINTQYGVVSLTPPIGKVGPVGADAAGMAQWTAFVPAAALGKTLYIQALELTPSGAGELTNALAEIVN